MVTPATTWTIRGRVLDLAPRALVMGIVNVTPDSFSDGGRFADTDRAIAHALELVAQGADLLDIGGESSRPGATPVSAEEEAARVVPVIEALAKQCPLPISVDTCKAHVAAAALAAGAHIVNDITALTGDPDMGRVVADSGAGVVLMHMQGTPQTMQLAPTYGDVVGEVSAYLQTRLQATADLGIAGDRVVLDPGIGFGKTSEHNRVLLARLGELGRLGRPVLLGVSRKGFLGRMLNNRPVTERLAASLACACDAVVRRTARLIRAHDVAASRDAVEVIAAIERGRTDVVGPPDPAV